MKYTEKNDHLNSIADDNYFKLLSNKVYEIFNPKINSEEEEVLDALRSLIKELLGLKVLNIDIN